MRVAASLHDSIVLNAWSIMAVLCGCISPTEELMSYLFPFFLGKSGKKKVKQLKDVCNHLLQKTVIMKQRKEIPTNCEICAILVLSLLPHYQNASTVSVRVYLLNKNFVVLHVTPGTTVKDLSHQVASLLHLDANEQFFTMYETDGRCFLSRGS